MKTEDAIKAKVKYLHSILGEGYTTIPAVAAKVLHMDAGTLRADPTLPVIMVGSRRKIPIDRLAEWLVKKERV